MNRKINNILVKTLILCLILSILGTSSVVLADDKKGQNIKEKNSIEIISNAEDIVLTIHETPKLLTKKSKTDSEINLLSKASTSKTVTKSVYTPFINYIDQVLPNMSNTPQNESIQTAFQRIKANNSSISYSRITPESSQYFVTTTINGISQHFYAMVIKYTTSYHVEDYGVILYNQNYKSHPLFNNGYYNKGYPGLNYRAGVIWTYQPIKKYSWTDFGEYRRFYLHDLFNLSISFSEDGYDPTNRFPLFVSWVTAGNRIIYGQAKWFADGSGSNKLFRIDRFNNNKIRNNNIYFLTQDEFESGIALTYDIYTFLSSVDGLQYTIDLNTLNVLNIN